jgi:hypothetical protein
VVTIGYPMRSPASRCDFDTIAVVVVHTNMTWCRIYESSNSGEAQHRSVPADSAMVVRMEANATAVLHPTHARNNAQPHALPTGPLPQPCLCAGLRGCSRAGASPKSHT